MIRSPATVPGPLSPLVAIVTILFSFCAFAARDEASGARRVRAVRFEGVARAQQDDLRARLGDLVDGPATEDRLAEAVRRLEAVRALGGLDVELRPTRRGGLVDVVFRADGEPRHLAALRLTTRAEGEADGDESWRLARQVQTAQGAFHSGEGRRFHPYLLRLDAEKVLRLFRDRGHRDAEVETILAEEGDLVTATLRVRPGPRYRVTAVRIDGVEEKRGQILEKLDTRPEGPVVPDGLLKDAERVRAFYCALGLPDVEVTAKQAPTGDTGIQVTFHVRPGPFVRVGTLRLEGHAIPEEVLDRLAVKAGRPFCPDQVAASEERIAALLRESGHPDADIESRVERVKGKSAGEPESANVVIAMRPGGQARVERIWFEGNSITRESVLRQLLAIEEGDVLRQSALDQSVQALRRSDLFKSASVRVIRGSRPTTRYLLFTVEEAQQIAIDLLGQTLTFRNVDLADWPEDWEDLAQGVSLRGGGQRVRFYAQEDWQGVEFTDAFVSRHLLTRAALFRRTDDVDGTEEAWYTVEAGFGLQAFESRASLVPLFQLEYTSLEARSAFAGLPIRAGDVWTTALGVEGRLDLNLRDAERVPYIGFDVRGRALFGLEDLGGDLGWRSVDAGARVHVPLGTNRRDQHYVLRLASRFAQVDPDESGELLAHQRAFPDIRGFDARSIGVPFDVAADETIVLGGTTAATASAELRVPIPVGRRNAFAPFLDVATVSGDDDPFLANPHAAAGVTLYFSVFSERLEGYLHGAWPLLGDAGDEQYVGGGLGGAF